MTIPQTNLNKMTIEIENFKIIEYVSIILYKKQTNQIWFSKRTNPAKEFYQHWQCPGGHIKEKDLTARHAARRELFEEIGTYLYNNLNIYKPIII